MPVVQLSGVHLLCVFCLRELPDLENCRRPEHVHFFSAGVTASVVQCSEFLTTDPGVRVRLPALPDFLRSSGSGTGSTQSREYKLGAT
jgi:hypothetical protein